MKFPLLSLTLSLLFALSWFDAEAFKLRIDIGEEEEFRFQSQTFLFGSYINQRKVIDSVFASNTVLFNLPDDLPVGLYSVMIYTDMKNPEDKYQRLGFDLIITGFDLAFTVEVKDDHTLGMVKGVSGENLAYYQHFNKGFLRGKRMAALETAINEYPPGDSFYQQLVDQSERIRLEHQQSTTSIGDGKTNHMANFYFQAQKAVEHGSIEGVDFSNSWLKQSQFIPMLVYEYLKFDETDGSSGANFQALNERLSTIFSKLKADEEVFELMLTDVINHYEKIGKTEAVVYLNEDFLLPVVCENQALSEEVRAKNESLKKIVIGQPAPNINFNESFRFKNLNEIPADYLLLLFWETNCPHCQDLTDELSAFFNKRNNGSFQVVAMALDTSKVEYEKYISSKNFAWYDGTDFSGWDGETARTYSVLATPSMFLLDKNRKIVAKPRNIIQIRNFLTLAGR